MIVEQCNDVEEIRDIAEQWLAEASPDEFGLIVDSDTVKADLEMWMKGEGIVLMAKEADTVIGLIAVFAVPSYLGPQKIAMEKYWYTRPGSMFAGSRLYLEAVKWATEHGCSHLLTSGSKMASERHDAICNFLDKTGAQHFETSYLYKLGDT